MKRYIALIVIAFSIISFSSCKDENNNNSTSSPYVNISLKDAKRYVGLDFNSVKDEMLAKGFIHRYDDLELNSYRFTNSDTTLIYSFQINSSNIIYRVDYSKTNKNIDNSLSNYEFCQRECINETDSTTLVSYVGTNQILFGDEFYSQEEFQAYFNLNKYNISFCAELWQSDQFGYGVLYMNMQAFGINNNQMETTTSSNTTTPTTPQEQTYTNPFGVGVMYFNKSLAPEEELDKTNLKNFYSKIIPHQ